MAWRKGSRSNSRACVSQRFQSSRVLQPQIWNFSKLCICICNRQVGISSGLTCKYILVQAHSQVNQLVSYKSFNYGNNSRLLQARPRWARVTVISYRMYYWNIHQSCWTWRLSLSLRFESRAGLTHTLSLSLTVMSAADVVVRISANCHHEKQSRIAWLLARL